MTANLLNSFGTDFQKKVLYNLLNDENFFTRIIDILDPNYFENEAMSWVVEKMYDYYETYKIQPTIDFIPQRTLTIPETPLNYLAFSTYNCRSYLRPSYKNDAVVLRRFHPHTGL